jgi:DNA-binding NarL/FixJ family response regulator
VRSYSPDVAIVDIRMPPTHTDEGLRAAREIREKHPETGVLVLSQYVEPSTRSTCSSESAEGVGYLLKDRVSDVGEFAGACAASARAARRSTRGRRAARRPAPARTTRSPTSRRARRRCSS